MQLCKPADVVCCLFRGAAAVLSQNPPLDLKLIQDIQATQKETNDALVKAINEELKRGERLEAIEDSSKTLSLNAKIFNKASRKRCCGPGH